MVAGLGLCPRSDCFRQAWWFLLSVPMEHVREAKSAIAIAMSRVTGKGEGKETCSRPLWPPGPPKGEEDPLFKGQFSLV